MSLHAMVRGEYECDGRGCSANFIIERLAKLSDPPGFLEPAKCSVMPDAEVFQLLDKLGWKVDYESGKAFCWECIGNGNSLRVPVGAISGDANPRGQAQGRTLPSASPREAQQLPGGISKGRIQGSSEPERAQAPHPKVVHNSAALFGRSTKQEDRDSAERIEFEPSTIERKVSKTKDAKPFLKVSWKNNNGRGWSSATVFDDSLFAEVEASLRNGIRAFYVLRKGNYMHIIGVQP